MMGNDDLVAILRSCCKWATDPNGCKPCPFLFEEQLDQFLYRMHCAAEDAADELEKAWKR